jgi:hypothetical protein
VTRYLVVSLIEANSTYFNIFENLESQIHFGGQYFTLSPFLCQIGIFIDYQCAGEAARLLRASVTYRLVRLWVYLLK